MLERMDGTITTSWGLLCLLSCVSLMLELEFSSSFGPTWGMVTCAFEVNGLIDDSVEETSEQPGKPLVPQCIHERASILLCRFQPCSSNAASKKKLLQPVFGHGLPSISKRSGNSADFGYLRLRCKFHCWVGLWLRFVMHAETQNMANGKPHSPVHELGGIRLGEAVGWSASAM